MNGSTSTRRPAQALLGARWLLSANGSSPSAARITADWRARRLGEIRVGRIFELIRVTDQRLGQVAFEDLLRARVPVGPVLLNLPLGAVEFLTTAVPEPGWSMPDSEHLTRQLTRSSWVTVKVPPPGPYRIDGRVWLRAPDGGQALTSPANLATALSRARSLMRRAPAVAGRCLSRTP
ncbi:hypothetical protein ACFZB9_19340 [Kitasatospora sp. NPDC008050]|uniref:hypothetical protein n=1 Tax=Kitasatospora sp. NPDC008050 TaxID=3364021 RepID=UPI0036EAC2AE